MRNLIAIGLVVGSLGACSWATEPPARFAAVEQVEQAPTGAVPITTASWDRWASDTSSDRASSRPFEQIADRVARSLLGNRVSARVRRRIVRQAARLARRFLGRMGTGGAAWRKLRDLGRRLWGNGRGLGALFGKGLRDRLHSRRYPSASRRGSSWRRQRRARCWKGDVRACRREARAFDRNVWGTPNPLRARIYYRKACRLGHARSCRDLASIYESGRGLRRPLPRLARRYYAKACRAGDRSACRAATRLRQDGPTRRLRWAPRRLPGTGPTGSALLRTIRI